MPRAFIGSVIPCTVCGKPMRLSPSQEGRQFCSKKCYGQDRLRTADTFWDKVDQSGGPDACWSWTGPKAGGQHGKYGHLVYHRAHVYAHRLAWELTNSPVTGDLFVLHSCDNPICCNPTHLFLGDHQANMDDMVSKGRSSAGKPRPDAKILRGEDHPGAKLTNEQAEELRTRYASEEISQYALAQEYGVHPMTVYRIIRGHRYEANFH